MAGRWRFLRCSRMSQCGGRQHIFLTLTLRSVTYAHLYVNVEVQSFSCHNFEGFLGFTWLLSCCSAHSSLVFGVECASVCLKCLKQALKDETKEKYPMFRWAYLPYSMKMAGPREAIQHMIIRKWGLPNPFLLAAL